MKTLICGIVLALALAALSFAGCALFEDREDVKPDPDPYDGVYVHGHVLEKMETMRKAGKWRQPE